MKNKEIRLAAMKADVKLWQIAEKLGMTDSSFSRKMRRELPDDLKQRVLSIIEEIRSSEVVAS